MSEKFPTADEVLEVYKVAQALDKRFIGHSQNGQQSNASQAVRDSLHSLMRAVEALSFDERLKAHDLKWK